MLAKPLKTAKPPKRNGSVLVEFSLTLPIALIFLFGAIEMTRANFLRHSAKTAAYEGARQGSLLGGTAASASDRADSIMRSVGVQGATAVVTPNNLSDESPEITVTVQVPMSRNLWGVARFFHRDALLEQSCTLTRDTAQSGY